MGWGEFFALSSAFFWALGIVLFRRAGETLPPFETNLFKNLLGFALMWPTILVLDGLSPPDFSTTEFFVVVLSGFLGIAVEAERERKKDSSGDENIAPVGLLRRGWHSIDEGEPVQIAAESHDFVS